MTEFDVETRLADYFTWLEDSTGQSMSFGARADKPVSMAGQHSDHRTRRRDGTRRRWLLSAAVLIAVLAGAVSLLWPRESDQPVWAAEAVAVATQSPRLLIRGWAVEGVGAFSIENGEMTFESGGRTADLFWTPASMLNDRVNDRVQSSTSTTTTSVGDIEWTMFDDGRSGHRAIALVDGSTIEVVASPTNESEFIDLLGRIESVDVDTWLSALPASIVQPGSQIAVVEQMTADIPLPPGLEVSDITDTDIVGNRAQVAVAVLQPVVCGWIDTWFTAKESGDQQLVDQVEEVLGTAREWAVVEEMIGGPWTDSLLQRTNAVATGSLITDGSSPESINRDNLAGIGCSPST